MALSDDLLGGDAREENQRPHREAHRHARGEATAAIRTKLSDWRVDLHWEDAVRRTARVVDAPAASRAARGDPRAHGLLVAVARRRGRLDRRVADHPAVGRVVGDDRQRSRRLPVRARRIPDLRARGDPRRGALGLGSASACCSSSPRSICFVNPTHTFAALANLLGFLFGLVGVWWMIEAFLERPLNPLWWMGLIAGILMTGLAFWMAGQLFVDKAYLLLVSAGLWALMQGITHIARAFAIRRLTTS